MVHPHLGRQVEQLGRLGLVVDGLRATLVERHQLVELTRLAIRLAQREKGFCMGRILLKDLLVLSYRRHEC